MARQPSRRRPQSRSQRLRSYAVRILRFAILAVIVVGAISLTIGTGIAPVDDTVDDTATGIGDFLTGLGASPDGSAAGDSSTINATTERERLELAIHERVNEARQERGLEALAFDTDLREIARYHSADMANRSYFSHTSPDGNTMEDRYERFGYDCRVPTDGMSYKTGGENLFKISSADSLSNEELADRAVEGWLNSPAHRENLLDADWRQEGIGTAWTEDGTLYVTQNFC